MGSSWDVTCPSYHPTVLFRLKDEIAAERLDKLDRRDSRWILVLPRTSYPSNLSNQS
jgi:hypothetical protein